MASPVLAVVEIPVSALQSAICGAEEKQHSQDLSEPNFALQNRSRSPVLDTTTLFFPEPNRSCRVIGGIAVRPFALEDSS